MKALTHWSNNRKNYQEILEDTWRLFFIQRWYVSHTRDHNQALYETSLYEAIIYPGLSFVVMEENK